MVRICAWCNKYLGTTPGSGITHGICHECDTPFYGVRTMVALH